VEISSCTCATAVLAWEVERSDLDVEGWWGDLGIGDADNDEK
jgi:hypothetical protein